MTYQVELFNPIGQRVAVLVDIISLVYRRVVNGTGVYSSAGRNVLPLQLVLPYSLSLFRLLQRDSQLVVYRAGRWEMDTIWYIRRVVVRSVGQQRTIEVSAVPAIALLADRVVAYPAGSPQSAKVGPADDVARSIVLENFGVLALTERDIGGWLVVAGVLSQAPTVSIACAWRNVADVLGDLVRMSAELGTPLYFDVDATRTFRTYVGQRGANRTVMGWRPLILSTETMTLDDAERVTDYEDEATVVYAGGRGVEAERMVAAATALGRAALSPVGRREVFVDARHLADPAALSNYATQALHTRRPRETFRARVVSTDTLQYGEWQWGDRVTVEAYGASFSADIADVEVRFVEGVETVTALLQADGVTLPDVAVLSETEHTYQQIQATVVRAGQSVTIPAAGQLVAYGSYEVIGTLELLPGSQLVILN